MRAPLLALLVSLPLVSGCRAPMRTPAAVETVQTVYVVRHAERLDASGDPPLSAAGEARARALADSLGRWGAPLASFSTRFVRAQRTATLAVPTLTPQRYDRSADAAADARALAASVLAGEAGTGTVLVVGHSNTVPSVVNGFDGGARPDLSERDYDGVYVVRIHRRSASGLATAPSVVRVVVERRRVGADDGVPDPR